MGNMMGIFFVSKGGYKNEKKQGKLGNKRIVQHVDHNVDISDRVLSIPIVHDEKFQFEECSDSAKDVRNFVCDICVEKTALDDSFNPKGCLHFYCIQCITRYIASKLDDNLIHISCPVSGCQGVLEPDDCRAILPVTVFDRWGIALCEYGIDDSMKFYCPYVDCSALLLNNPTENMEECYCPFCDRAACAKCKTPWHPELSCIKFQELKKQGEDVMLLDLAERKKWRRCPKCKIFVDRKDGCRYMRCRCGTRFCYACGSMDVDTETHYCYQCKATW